MAYVVALCQSALRDHLAWLSGVGFQRCLKVIEKFQVCFINYFSFFVGMTKRPVENNFKGGKVCLGAQFQRSQCIDG